MASLYRLDKKKPFKDVPCVKAASINGKKGDFIATSTQNRPSAHSECRGGIIRAPETPPISESGQTDFSTNLSALAPPSKEMMSIWWDFRKVAEFIDINRGWLLPLLDTESSKNE